MSYSFSLKFIRWREPARKSVDEVNISLSRLKMHKARFRVMAGLAGATLCLFAVAANGQNPTTTDSHWSSGSGRRRPERRAHYANGDEPGCARASDDGRKRNHHWYGHRRFDNDHYDPDLPRRNAGDTRGSRVGASTALRAIPGPRSHRCSRHLRSDTACHLAP